MYITVSCSGTIAPQDKQRRIMTNVATDVQEWKLHAFVGCPLGADVH
jgi:hypothetical protein